MENEQPDPENIRANSADLAFVSSEGRTFLGEPLMAFSVRRQFAAQQLGNKLLSGRARYVTVPCQCNGDDPACTNCQGTGEISAPYDGMFHDMMVVIYLCRCPKSEIMLASRKPETVVDNALSWAEQVNVAVGSPAFLEACSVYGDIMRELTQAQFQITETPGGSNSAKNG